MNIALEPGAYVVAVSGGVDSMALLDMLADLQATVGNDYRFLVAHLDHGIRHDSDIDRKMVQVTAKGHGLPFIYDEAHLGPDTSEADARKARYDFLHRVRKASQSRAIITAHHQDDLLETAILNLLRGTGRKGLSSLASTDVVIRPLLDVPKRRLIEHARRHGLIWREDVTNQDTRYMRNYIRHNILPRLDEGSRARLLELIHDLHRINRDIDHQLINHLHLQPAIDRLDRQWFIMLPHAVATEVMAAWLRRHGIRDFDRPTIDRLVQAAKTYVPGRRTDIGRGYRLKISRTYLALGTSDR
jgi:tRNA(Ile)-lysidine synthase